LLASGSVLVSSARVTRERHTCASLSPSASIWIDRERAVARGSVLIIVSADRHTQAFICLLVLVYGYRERAQCWREVVC